MGNYQAEKARSQLSGGNAAYIEALYELYLEAPEQVSAQWRSYFDEVRAGQDDEQPRLPVQERFEHLAQLTSVAAEDHEAVNKQVAVLALISGYRSRGHQIADLCPIALRPRREVPDVDYHWHGLTDDDMERSFNTGTLFNGGEMKLKDIITYLDKAYKYHIGAEFSHIHNTEERRWLQQHLEQAAQGYGFSATRKREMLKLLVAADGLEKYLHKRFVGQKRFSLEGGDGLIPLMDSLIQRLGKNGTKEIGIAMAHRGRLNMLINILGKRPEDLFNEFEGKYAPQEGRSGDVKYHMGFSSTVDTEGGIVDLSLAFNPSHLEFVNSVVQGSMRARLERVQQAKSADSVFEISNYAVPVQIHGDAAFAGQGIIMETLQLSQVRGYRVGGSMHIIVNNQIGFTTSNPLDTRSAMYCSDAAKLIQAPVLHVNGDDPEAIVFAAELAADYLRKFQKDVFIDVICYRRLGHNEADEPSATQPMMYQKIRKHAVPAQVYAEQLVAEGVIAANEYEKMQEDYRQRLEAGNSVARPQPLADTDPLEQAWKALRHQNWNAPVDTTYPAEALTRLGEKIFTPPADFMPHPIVEKVMATRVEMSAGHQSLDWGAAENLAYASLLEQGYSVRVSGEDCGRGTFSHRHAVIHDQTTGDSYTPLAHLYEGQPSVRVIDSILSENAVLGFEYGFATAEPHGLVIWEAQFGDFANGAQVIIDQFVTSGESKWGRYCGLTMLLPHGYEGQGPEHSSARLERYLQLCADKNVQVCVPTTPAQIFHLLRRQVLRQFRKPLIVMSPKSLLRNKLAVSDLSELSEGAFQAFIGEQDTLVAADKVKRVILCCGKVYYELLQKRREAGINDIAILRVEQLYPFPTEAVAEALASYRHAEIVWCQEEPRNQGAWRQIYEWLEPALPAGKKPLYVGRAASASTAAGYLKLHNAEQAALVREALGLAQE
ncbi:MAG: 2-oxoglutarate dehydrogenase E1 component [Cardiobacteriaceae bacterium]|nr:2-oxoglutarate dehydrogenase E1 component [Cardiobacteriaceae bacterium]